MFGDSNWSWNRFVESMHHCMFRVIDRLWPSPSIMLFRVCFSWCFCWRGGGESEVWVSWQAVMNRRMMGRIALIVVGF